jgi:hypothetical protein
MHLKSDVSRGADRNLSYLSSGPAIVLFVAAALLLLHLFTAERYGIFRDELYILACSQHLAWGYVDHPPLIDLIAWFSRHVFGESLLGLRFLPALAGAALVWLTGALTAEMGGGRFAQVLSAVAVVFVPYYLIIDHLLMMNAFEPLIWMGCAWCTVRAFNTSNPRYWLLFGVIAGVGLENKYSIVFFAFGTFAGLLFTRSWRFLGSRWLWMGVLAAIAIFLPNLLWSIRHGFPFLELMHNIRTSGRDIVRSPLAFIADQAMVHNPLLFPLWATGFFWLLVAQRARPYRVLGITFLVVFATLVALHGKNYYVSPVYPMLFAAGSIAFEDFTAFRWRGTRAAYLSIVIILGLVIAPIMVPILPVESFIRYQKAIGYPAPAFEHQRNGVLPQYFADEFGWEDMVRITAKAFNQLSPSDRAKAGIFANDFGEAGAIDFFGPRYGLPKAISNHVNYWMWGPDHVSGAVVLVLGSDGRGDREHFRTVEAAGVVDNPYSRLDEHFTVWLCRDINFSVQEKWPQLKKYN